MHRRAEDDPHFWMTSVQSDSGQLGGLSPGTHSSPADTTRHCFAVSAGTLELHGLEESKTMKSS